MIEAIKISGRFNRIDGATGPEESAPERRVIAGLASVPSEVDSYGTIFSLDALEGALAGFMEAPVLRFLHKTPIGKVLSAFTDSAGNELKTEVREEGLFIVAEIATGTQAADEAWALIDQAVINGFSIGGQIGGEENMTWTHINGEEVGIINKFRLVEISVVDLPANSAARFQAVRMADLNSRGDNITQKDERQGGTPPEETPAEAPSAAPDNAPDLMARVEALEGEVATLEGALGELRAMVEAIAAAPENEPETPGTPGQVQNQDTIEEPEERRGAMIGTNGAITPEDLRTTDRKDLLKVLEKAGRF